MHALYADAYTFIMMRLSATCVPATSSLTCAGNKEPASCCGFLQAWVGGADRTCSCMHHLLLRLSALCVPTASSPTESEILSVFVVKGRISLAPGS